MLSLVSLLSFLFSFLGFSFCFCCQVLIPAINIHLTSANNCCANRCGVSAVYGCHLIEMLLYLTLPCASDLNGLFLNESWLLVSITAE